MVLVRPPGLGSEPGHPDLRSTEAGQRLLLYSRLQFPKRGLGGRLLGASPSALVSSPPGYAPALPAPSSYDADQKPGLELAPAEPMAPARRPRKSTATPRPPSGDPACPARYFRGEAAVTDSYSMDAFFISDGRSRRRRGRDAGGAGDAGSGGGRAGARRGRQRAAGTGTRAPSAARRTPRRQT